MFIMPFENKIAKAILMSVGVIISLLIAPNSVAIDGCIQAPKRNTPCEHQIYKMMKLHKDKPAKITCICLSDFKKFLTEPTDEVEKQLRKLELKGLAADLQLTQEQIKNLAKR